MTTGKTIAFSAPKYEWGLAGWGAQFSPHQMLTVRIAPSFTSRVHDLIVIIVMKTISGNNMKNTFRTPVNIHAFLRFSNAAVCPRIHSSALRERRDPLHPVTFCSHLCERLITAGTIEEMLAIFL